MFDTGLASLLEPLTEGLNIQYRRIVTSVKYDKEHDQVLVEYSSNPTSPASNDFDSQSSLESSTSSSGVYKADVIVMCAPLGCLKESKTKELKVDRDDNLCIPPIKFDPPLSREKREAIEGVKIGSVNKVILIFENRFWSDNCFFGRVNDKETARGELFLFSSSPNSSVLYSHLVGASANIGDCFKEEDFANKLMQILGRIFGADCPSAPKEVIVTSWHTNGLAHGCFPYIPVGRTDEDYDTLAQPAEVVVNNQRCKPYVFFAGDHTCREYPGRLHGAFLSGTREAARIANLYLGRIDSKEVREEYEQLGQSYIKNMINKKEEEVYLSD